jgi:selenocysteine lyase/cysteine desulfurase
MWQILDKGREVIRRKLSELGGVMAEEVAINRNTTEGLGTIASGLSLNKGDEIVMTRMDYPNMLQMWKQKEMREGVKINWVNIDLPEAKDEQIIQAFIQATTSRTKVWHITHMINWTGQILPVKQLCEEASKRNILSIVDAAHTFAQLDFTIADLKPDYLATSLHKWLCAPFGSGMLYVKKDRIEPLWPLFPNDNPKSGDIKKFEVLGTRSFATEQAIGQAIEFHRAIGGKRKQERLHYLKTYWADKISSHSRVRLHTPLNKESSCALACFSIEGIEPDAIVSKLFNEHQILTVPIKIEGVKGVRVTPHIYTTTRDLDRFVAAVMKIASL